ncbi:MAG: cytochrome c maturation protein CcmE [Chloroflexi bacterium]|nr:cytochrome c maturation protein CcmE [Chloroflexota bacterium]
MKEMKFVVAGVVLAVAIGYLVMTGVQTTAVYYLTVGELLGQGASATGRSVRVSGDVVPGSIEKIENGLALRFQVADASGKMPVSYRGGPVPDIFADQVQVVVEGKLQPDGVFYADTLLAKCPSKFEDGGTGQAAAT